LVSVIFFLHKCFHIGFYHKDANFKLNFQFSRLVVIPALNKHLCLFLNTKCARSLKGV
jgi:hypothetical protein